MLFEHCSRDSTCLACIYGSVINGWLLFLVLSIGSFSFCRLWYKQLFRNCRLYSLIGVTIGGQGMENMLNFLIEFLLEEEMFIARLKR